MINIAVISASRRTDIPAFYSDWFLNRIKEGYVDVINPFNTKQANRLSLSKKDVDCIVFWTKNPQPLLEKIDKLDGYRYYFQFTVNGYGKEAEPGVPDLDMIAETFINLSDKIGKEKVIWRYDPIIITPEFTVNWHCKHFSEIAEMLHNYTEKCVFSFADMYARTKRNCKDLSLRDITAEEIETIASSFSDTCHRYNLEISTCCEAADLQKYGITHNRCIDDVLIKRLFGVSVDSKKDAQREHCGCVKCTDIGAYNTCLHRCKYCYATFNHDRVVDNVKGHDPSSSILIGKLADDVKIYPKKRTTSTLDDF